MSIHGKVRTEHMSERLNNLRSSYARVEKHSGEDVNTYVFIESAVDIPDEPDNGDWASKMLRYKELYEKTESARKKKEQPSPRDIAEKQELHAELNGYLSGRFKTFRKSILKNSLAVPRKPDAGGKDSQVYYYGSKEDFLAHPDTPRYVSKYSHTEKGEATPSNILYLKKKCQLLRKLMMGEQIPRAWFILGEFRHGIPKHEEGKFHTSVRAITVQREIRGKTFTEMTPAVRERKEVQRALKEGIADYLAARDILIKACKEVGVPYKAFEMGLDIGDASPETAEAPFNPLTYTSPNIMYDERKKKVYFIDMGWGEWTAEKELVFNHLMGKKRRKNARKAA